MIRVMVLVAMLLSVPVPLMAGHDGASVGPSLLKQAPERSAVAAPTAPASSRRDSMEMRRVGFFDLSPIGMIVVSVMVLLIVIVVAAVIAVANPISPGAGIM